MKLLFPKRISGIRVFDIDKIHALSFNYDQNLTVFLTAKSSAQIKQLQSSLKVFSKSLKKLEYTESLSELIQIKSKTLKKKDFLDKFFLIYQYDFMNPEIRERLSMKEDTGFNLNLQSIWNMAFGKKRITFDISNKESQVQNEFDFFDSFSSLGFGDPEEPVSEIRIRKSFVNSCDY